MFFVVVVSLVQIDLTNPKEVLQLAQTRKALCALCDRELMRHLDAGPVTLAISSLGLTDEVDRKATFSIHKTNNPTDLNQSFLLIVRTSRIVTAA